MSHVPETFPRLARIGGVVPEMQPKVCVVRSGDTYVVPSDDEELEERWELCEDLARQLCPVAIRDATRHSRPDALGRVRIAVGRRSWVTAAELDWVMQRLRTLLGW